jgi:hypothetical protein
MTEASLSLGRSRSGLKGAALILPGCRREAGDSHGHRVKLLTQPKSIFTRRFSPAGNILIRQRF